MNARVIDMTGNRYASLIALRPSGSAKSGDLKWQFRCDCGSEFEANGYYARSGKIISCKKCGLERTRIASVKHGLSETPEFYIWTGIHTRCYNQNATSYKNYGARGVVICDRWKDSFENFLLDMGERPSNNHSIDRIDNDGNYSPENCKWSTPKEQANNKRNNVKVTIDGVTKNISAWKHEFGMNVSAASFRRVHGLSGRNKAISTVRQIVYGGVSDTISGWSKRTGIKPTTIAMRINYGWTMERTLTHGASSC